MLILPPDMASLHVLRGQTGQLLDLFPCQPATQQEQEHHMFRNLQKNGFFSYRLEFVTNDLYH